MPSLTEHWTLANPNFSKDSLRPFQERLGISLHLAKLLQAIGLDTLEAAKDFLYPKLAQLEDPFEITNLKIAAQRLVKAIEHKETIYLIGDYDVDGVTSTVLFLSLLKELKHEAKYFIPRRMDEGYGLSQGAIERLLSEGKPDLLCVLDSGTNAHQEVAYLQEKGIEVIIIDHHQPKNQLPDCIIVNPHVYDTAEKPWKDMCTVGLVFKLMHALLKLLKETAPDLTQHIRLSDHLDLVAMGTIADLMPLSRENRILVKQGLKRLQQPSRLGLKALYTVSDIDSTHIQPLDISFKIGPRINASGRLADAALPVDMLLSNDASYCLQLAQELDAMNRERQDIERLIFQEAQAQVEKYFKDDPSLILHNEEWHSGVVGIVAGRLARQYKRPCIVLGKEGIYAKGSGRSAAGVNLIEALKGCSGVLKNFGGHPMAVGLSLEPECLKEFRILLNKALVENQNTSEARPELKIALQLQAQDISSAFLDELLLLHPYGEGNAEPIFSIEHVVLNKKPEAFGEGHYRFSLKVAKGEWAYGVAWKQGHKIPPAHVPIDLAVKLYWNHWNKRKNIQLELVDWRLAS
jgi:single-stranded-DNA-specific exonuclease